MQPRNGAKAEGGVIRKGPVAGYTLKVIREGLRLTQDRLAFNLEVSVETVKAWETGRRPLAGTSLEGFLRLQAELRRLGTPSALIDAVQAAVEADHVISHALSQTGDGGSPAGHPLATWWCDRLRAELLGWPLTSETPSVLQGLARPPRRGPVPLAPSITGCERQVLCAHLRVLAERSLAEAREPDPENIRIRHRVYSLLGRTSSPAAYEWLTWMGRREERRSSWHQDRSPLWMVGRALAAALARQGDRERLAHFVRTRVANHDSGEWANLHYWACWAGVAAPEPASLYRVPTLDPGTALGLLPVIEEGLALDNPCVDACIHTLWALLRRPVTWLVLRSMPLWATSLDIRVTRLLDRGDVSFRARTELEQIHSQLVRA